MNDQIPLMELPATDPSKARPKVNQLQEILAELMSERKIEAAEIQKATGIPWGTLQGWIKGDVGAQILDENILKLSKFFNVSIHYLAFGIGDDGPAFNTEENANANE